ncbi:MipA/OmpV family protein [Thalassotalea profundi]|uniref:MipA/OmpV family protein n=1 Tax=Thalassotalea profundi TaxID=2036687 RepID=A0ABQ3IEL3_9GAMM|nr:MipA/OmpV family protein [Thalassotalea profundi]GHE81525.1 hypothetical protein GCM10011501_07180 [Thalassotalea profundi]
MYYLLLAILVFTLSFPAISNTQLINFDKIKKTKVTNFSQQLGMAAITIPARVSGQHEKFLSNIYEVNDEALTHYNRAGNWFYQSPKANVWFGRLSPATINVTKEISNNERPNTQGLNAAINYGRFSMETALITENSNIKDSGTFYLQGAYTLLEKSPFNIAITAKVETLSEHNVNYYFGDNNQLEQGQSLIDYQAKNTTWGLIGTYEVTPKWTVIGAFTSTILDKDIMQSPLVSDSNINMALIGTSYSF